MNKDAIDLYADMGATPVINARGNRTFLGGSAPTPEILAAMQLAGRYYVDMDELLQSTGRIVAEMIQAEAALITPGCAAALVLGTSACITGTDPNKMARLPNATGLKNVVVIQRAQRYKYDRVVRLPGTTLIEAGNEAATTAEQHARAINDDTDAVLYPMIDNPAKIIGHPLRPQRPHRSSPPAQLRLLRNPRTARRRPPAENRPAGGRRRGRRPAPLALHGPRRPPPASCTSRGQPAPTIGRTAQSSDLQ